MTSEAEPLGCRGWARLMQIGSYKNNGFGYVGLLIAVAIFGLGAVGAARILASSDRGDREVELLFVGGQFRSAIQAYYESGPMAGQYPPTLEDLLQDGRVPITRRHLRRIFVDPISGKAEWGTVPSPQGGIMGVFSLSKSTPMKRQNFSKADVDLLQGAQPPASAPTAGYSVLSAKPIESTVNLSPINVSTYSYQDWKFIYRPANLSQTTVNPKSP